MISMAIATGEAGAITLFSAGIGHEREAWRHSTCKIVGMALSNDSRPDMLLGQAIRGQGPWVIGLACENVKI
ncbi:hypothetical protein Tsubulata_020768 [Turnera subulata]|uniref:Uncharacterized protein n=1 Tax=Turnera subulata TaxID=218843 RepID=A0A9Q0F060_9ROSI|nr:hypothetical protein Tsubulata_020768 [Turnera subulata]